MAQTAAELESRRNYALQMLAKGEFNAAQIAKEYGISDSTVRSWKARRKKSPVAKHVAIQQPVSLDATQPQPTGHNMEWGKEAIPAQVRQPVSLRFAKDALQNAHPADALYFASVAISCVGIVATLHGIGYAVAGVLVGTAFVVLQGLKTVAGWARTPYVLMFGIVEVANFVSHLAWANASLWDGVKSLPIEVWVNEYFTQAGNPVMVYQGDTDVPFYIAAGISIVLLCISGFAAWIAIQHSITRERARGAAQKPATI